MSSEALFDLGAAFALVAVIEGMLIGLFSTRLSDMLEQVRDVGPERMRWVGLGMAVFGTILYMAIRG